MKQDKLTLILSASEPLVCNLQELLGMDGYTCVISKNISEIKACFTGEYPLAFVLDELNNKGAFGELNKIVNGNTKIIVLCCDNDEKDYPMADASLGLPANIDCIPDMLSKRRPANGRPRS